MKVNPRRIILHTVLMIVGFIWIYPFIWMVTSSLKTNKEFITSGIKLWPESPQWNNYISAWNDANFSGYFLNTVIITVFSVLIILFVCSLAGYAMAKVKFPGRNLFIFLIVGTMFIPKGYTIIPVYTLIKNLGLLNHLFGVILALSGGTNVLFILLFMAYFNQIPKELEESATLDGASFLRTYVSVMLPISKPITATVGIMQFIWTWNAFLIPLVFTLNKPELRTLAVGMYQFVGEHSTDWVGMAAGSIISILPIVIVFISFQKYFIEGIAGSVKG